MSRKSFAVIIGGWVCICVVWLLVFLWLGAGGYDYLTTPKQPEPMIKSAKFDFTLEYLVKGDVYSVSDTLVCKFDGYSYPISSIRERSWDSYFREHPEDKHLVLYQWVETVGIETYAIVLRLFPAEYFMADPNVQRESEYPFTIHIFDGKRGYYLYDASREKLLLEQCGFDIINWSCDPPIENQFVE
ncbi:MAG: hypothetical protein IJX53_04140 [Clostridia bacterium]|nr:hypothetical protein [Clostridia bacterium]